jgi:chromosome segregation ATPase
MPLYTHSDSYPNSALGDSSSDEALSCLESEHGFMERITRRLEQVKQDKDSLALEADLTIQELVSLVAALEEKLRILTKQLKASQFEHRAHQQQEQLWSKLLAKSNEDNDAKLMQIHSLQQSLQQIQDSLFLEQSAAFQEYSAADAKPNTMLNLVQLTQTIAKLEQHMQHVEQQNTKQATEIQALQDVIDELHEQLRVVNGRGRNAVEGIGFAADQSNPFDVHNALLIEENSQLRHENVALKALNLAMLSKGLLKGEKLTAFVKSEMENL